jgi:hypothetical protein
VVQICSDPEIERRGPIGRVGIFTLFEGAVGIYVVEGNEQTFRTHFEPLAMAEIATAKALLATRFAKQAPDLIMAPPLSSAWLGVDTDES